MFDRILFPTDGSEGADAVFDRVLDVAETHAATVHVLNVADTAHDSVTRIQGEIVDVLEREGETVVEAAAQRATGRGIPAVTDVVQGGVAATVDAYTEEYGIDLIAMPTRGRTGLERLLLGSTTDRVLRRSSVPVLTLDPADDSVTYPARGVLVPTDGSAGAEAALELSVELAAGTGATLHVLCVADESDPAVGSPTDAGDRPASELVDAATSVAEDAGVGSVVGATETASSIRRAIESYVGTHDIDLVVMGARGRRGLERRLLGSVTERTVRSASVPVVTVPESHRTK
ncbi:UspA domain protein [Natronomonas moolapensis 8.8.11]|uniref:UspA domain protein n=1 Tax=Natronomonas moolapensis (strain DSM 18674 / CECT 7526 / JCM 14361 / 8.8.11) TaxID=268739 RepID=M1Y3H4_NATM8|nr:universal stress protein [Natronomonas moolapensis]CCQ37050.1 UspA domain protein [Natronomonas moolapensis 8.8.11]